jgi:hypothetical protein
MPNFGCRHPTYNPDGCCEMCVREEALRDVAPKLERLARIDAMIVTLFRTHAEGAGAPLVDRIAVISDLLAYGRARVAEVEAAERKAARAASRIPPGAIVRLRKRPPA